MRCMGIFFCIVNVKNISSSLGSTMSSCAHCECQKKLCLLIALNWVNGVVNVRYLLLLPFFGLSINDCSISWALHRQLDRKTIFN